MPNSYPPGREQLIRAMTDALMQLPEAKARGLVLMQSNLMSLPPQRLAMTLKIQRPDLSDATIAEMVGVDRSTPHRWHDYQRLKRSLSAPAEPMRGTVDSDGKFEAW